MEYLKIIISIVALLLALASFFYTWKTNAKKYELSETFRKEIMGWYDRCINVLVLLRKRIDIDNISDDKFCELNATLYSLTELGRFYFPNYNRENGKGIKNSEAYKGNRPLLIDLLVKSYNIASIKSNELLEKKDYYLSELKIYQKGFTSELFKLIDPDEQLKRHLNNTKINIIQHKTFSESEYHPDNRCHCLNKQ